MNQLLFENHIEADLASITLIFNQAIRNGNTALWHERSIDEMKVLIQRKQDSLYPLRVLKNEKKATLGWASLSPYRDGREGLKNTAEISYFVHEQHYRKGYGRKMVDSMCEHALSLGHHCLLAYIISDNLASRTLIQKVGFECWGMLPNVVNKKNGLTCDHLIYGIRLRD